jgi:hypothetical protein
MKVFDWFLRYDVSIIVYPPPPPYVCIFLGGFPMEYSKVNPAHYFQDPSVLSKTYG